MKKKNDIVLALESAVCGGSISLIRDGCEIANWIGSKTVSKAEDLLPNIHRLLTGNNISRHEIGIIAVSAGPGSFTGIRIGIATALGFGRALGIGISSGSILRAMVFGQATDQECIAAIPMGRNAVCFQNFLRGHGEITELDAPQSLREDQFFAFLKSRPRKNIILHASLYEKIDSTDSMVDFGYNLAFAIGAMCLNRQAEQTMPLFIAKSFT